MARIDEIKKEITDNFISHEAVAAAYGLDADKTFEEQFSKISLESVLFYDDAYRALLMEELFKYNLELMDERIRNQRVHTPGWYRSTALEFQFGKADAGVNISVVSENADRLVLYLTVRYDAMLMDGELLPFAASIDNAKILIEETAETAAYQGGELLPAYYAREKYANEIVLPAYYIASVNIENVYHDLMAAQPCETALKVENGVSHNCESTLKLEKEVSHCCESTSKVENRVSQGCENALKVKNRVSQGCENALKVENGVSQGCESTLLGLYIPFNGICLTDTFQLGETKDGEGLFSDMFPQNSRRVLPSERNKKANTAERGNGVRFHHGRRF